MWATPPPPPLAPVDGDLTSLIGGFSWCLDSIILMVDLELGCERVIQRCGLSKLMHQIQFDEAQASGWINQPINQTINQSIRPSIHQSNLIAPGSMAIERRPTRNSAGSKKRPMNKKHAELWSTTQRHLIRVFVVINPLMLESITGHWLRGKRRRKRNTTEPESEEKVGATSGRGGEGRWEGKKEGFKPVWFDVQYWLHFDAIEWKRPGDGGWRHFHVESIRW